MVDFTSGASTDLGSFELFSLFIRRSALYTLFGALPDTAIPEALYLSARSLLSSAIRPLRHIRDWGKKSLTVSFIAIDITAGNGG